MRLTDLPILSAGGALSNSFDFVRLNKCKMEFLPKYNQASYTIAPGNTPTFLTGLDEIPMTKTSGALTVAPTWSSQGGDDGSISETKAYDHPIITADYIRGMPNCVETEFYKKHTVWFTPTFYSTLTSVAAGPTEPTNESGVFQRHQKKWVNLNYLPESAGTEVQSPGPDFYGPMYAFSFGASTLNSPFYDVKIHYSVSFRRVRGI